jgi:HEAT repeat protein
MDMGGLYELLLLSCCAAFVLPPVAAAVGAGRAGSAGRVLFAAFIGGVVGLAAAGLYGAWLSKPDTEWLWVAYPISGLVAYGVARANPRPTPPGAELAPAPGRVRRVGRRAVDILALVLFVGWLVCGVRFVVAVDRARPEDVPRLIQSLAQDDETDWGRSVHLLAKLGETAAPALADALKDPDPRVRRGAARALRDMSWRAQAVTPQLAEALATGDLEVRQYAAEALGHCSTGPADIAVAVPALAVALDDAEWKMRFNAASAMSWIALNNGPQAASAIPVLEKALSHRDETVRHYAAQALGHIGPAAAAAVPKLRGALGDESGSVRHSAAQALGRIGPAADVVPDLRRALGDSDNYTRAAAVEALGRIGPAADVVPDLRRALGDPSDTVRRSAASALGDIGPAASAAVPELSRALRDGSDMVRWSAASALGRIGPAAAAAAPDLRRALGDPSDAVRLYAAEALPKVVPPEGGGR